MSQRKSTRHVTRRVRFAHAFKLDGMKHDEPAGTYSVETHPAHTGLHSMFRGREESTWIRLCEPPGIEGKLRMVKIEPGSLTSALILDANRNRGKSPQ